MDPWLSAGVGLIGASIGAAAALGGLFAQLRAQAKSEAARELKLAVEEVIARSLAIELRAHQMILLATSLGSFNGVASRVLGTLAPVDLLAVFDSINAEATALQRAAARVWLFADAETVSRVNAVALAAADVVSAHHEPVDGWTKHQARIALFGRYRVDEAHLETAREHLAQAREALVNVSREALGLPEVGLRAPEPAD